MQKIMQQEIKQPGGQKTELLPIRRDKRKAYPFEQVRYQASWPGIQGQLEAIKGQAVRLMDGRSDRIQLYLRRNKIGQEAGCKKLDMGDRAGVKGRAWRTDKGEISASLSALTLLAKSFRLLPEKWHGRKATGLDSPVDQKARFGRQALWGALGSGKANSMKEDAVNALAYAMPRRAARALTGWLCCSPAAPQYGMCCYCRRPFSRSLGVGGVQAFGRQKQKTKWV